MMNRRTFLIISFVTAVVFSLPNALFGEQLAPFKLYDTHGHFYTNEPDKYPFDASRARYGPERMIAKAMAHPMTPEVVFKFWDEVGIELGCGVQYNSTYRTDNSYLLDISAKYPKRIIPIVILDPVDQATPGTLAQMAKRNKIAGVRFTGVPDKKTGSFIFMTDAAKGAWTAANDLGLVIVLMPLGPMQPAMKQVAEMADRYPNVNIVLDHIGFPDLKKAPDTFGLLPEHLVLASRRNVYYKYTTLLMEMVMEANVPLKDFLHFMTGVYGADHMVWGTDIGNSEVPLKEFVQMAIDSADGLTLKQKKAIFYDTAKAVFVPGGRGPKHTD